MPDDNAEMVLSDAKENMQKSLSGLTHDLGKIRTGRANPALLEGLMVDYYGTPTPIKKLAQLNAPEARLITIQPFDRSAISEIEKAIHKANLGFSPVSDGKIVRVPIPELTEERRKVLVKQVKQLGEDHKVGVRNARRDAVALAKEMQKDGDLAEDDARHLTDKIQKLTDDFIAAIDKAMEAKEGELMKVWRPAVKLDPHRIPRHVAIIPDGNGRWAESRGLPRVAGYRNGAEVVREIVRGAHELGIKWLTFYAFSTENWKRPTEEIDAIMAYLQEYIVRDADELARNGIRVDAIGRLRNLSPRIQAQLADLISRTESNDEMRLTFALSYGGRAEIVDAVRSIARAVEAGALEPEAIDEKCIQANLYCKDMHDPDLLIRTGGEHRISNFLLWQLAYTEFFTSDALWPDFNKSKLVDALCAYQQRERRFGRTPVQARETES